MEEVLDEASIIVGRCQLSARQFSSFFGVCAGVCERALQLINNSKHSGLFLSSKHLLWGLMQLKIYSTESVLSSRAGVTEKTYRGWSFHAIKLISNLKVVSYVKALLFLPFSYQRYIHILNVSYIFRYT